MQMLQIKENMSDFYIWIDQSYLILEFISFFFKKNTKIK